MKCRPLFQGSAKAEGGAKRSKYRAKKTQVDGIIFDSRKEADYYCELRVRKMAGKIKDFERQVPFVLQPKFSYQGKTVREIKYIADFVITYPDGEQEVVDVKGVRTKEYLLKRKMLLCLHPDIHFVEV